MSDAFSNYLRDALNDHIHGGTTFTPPATYYCALMTVLPTSSGGGTEVSGGSYARVAVTNSTGEWDTSAAGIKQNINLIDWGTATADWGIIVGIAIYDASTSGNLIVMLELVSNTTVLNGQSFQISAFGLTIGYNAASSWSIYLQDAINDLVFGATSFTPAGTTYFALMTTMSAADGTGGTEATGGSYARVAVTNDVTEWPASAGQLIQNANPIDWRTATANHGTIVGVQEYDASTSGNLLVKKTFTTSIVYNIGIPLQVPAHGFQNTWRA